MSDVIRTTSPTIINLLPGEVFVFGSNAAGRHGKGAAKTALGWGAVYGQASGLQGRTYGLPTVNASVRGTLPLDRIRRHVDVFIAFAASRPDLTFLVTEVGCGLAGLSTKDVGPLFRAAIPLTNVRLPNKFWRALRIFSQEDLDARDPIEDETA